MKKMICLCMLCILGITGCDNASNSNQNALLYAENGEYNCTPQQLIDTINQFIQDTGDSRYCIIPDYAASGEEIEIIGDGILSCLSLTLYENDDGMLTKIEVDRNTFEEPVDSFNTYAAILGFLIGSISPDDSEEIMTQLDFENPSTNEYTTTAESNGTRYTYDYQLKGMYQYLTIEPESK